MNRRALLLGVATLLVVAIVAFALLAGPSIATSLSPTPTPSASQAGLANPASTYCVDRGYRSEIRNGPNGQSGVCIFPDGSEADEWAFFRGQAGVKWQTPAK